MYYDVYNDYNQIWKEMALDGSIMCAQITLLALNHCYPTYSRYAFNSSSKKWLIVDKSMLEQFESC